MTSWPTQQLGDITTKIGSGATPRGGRRSYKASGIPLIRSMNVLDLRLKQDGLAFIDEAQASKLDFVSVEEGDVLLNITGASVARCCLVQARHLPARVNQHVAILRPDPSRLDSRFLQYVLVAPGNKARLLSIAGGGATREALTKESLERFSINVPAMEVQERVGDVLSAYDDLIENNTRRIAILEEMAQVVYTASREDLPGSVLSSVPLGDVGRIVTGATPSTKVMDFWGTDLPFITPTDINSSGYSVHPARYLSHKGEAEIRSRILDPGAICFTCIGSIGKMCITTVRSVTNQQINSIEVDEMRFNRWFVFHLIRAHREHFLRIASGVATPIVSKSVFAEQAFQFPPLEVQNEVGDSLGTFGESVLNLERQCRTLASLRDLLLAPLVSGSIEVARLNDSVEEVGAL